jgi:hypothetical protein
MVLLNLVLAGHCLVWDAFFILNNSDLRLPATLLKTSCLQESPALLCGHYVGLPRNGSGISVHLGIFV